jgi:hypothetical protein
VVDHELRRNLRVDRARVAALLAHGVAHRGEVYDGRHAGEVLQQDASGVERDLLRGLGVGDPIRDRRGLILGAVAQHVLEQDPERVRQSGGGGIELVKPIALVADP